MVQAGPTKKSKAGAAEGPGRAGAGARRGSLSTAAGGWLLAAAITLIAATAGVTRAIVAAGEPGFPLDDAWIHVRLAQHAAAGDGLHFNLGQPAATATAPLWPLLLAVADRIGLGTPWASYACGVGASLLLAWSAGRFVSRAIGDPAAGAATAVLIVSTHPFPWLSISGMEATLAAALTILTVEAASTARTGMAFFLAALAAATRPELLILPPLIVVATAFRKWNQASFLLMAMGAAAACAAPFALNRVTAGAWLAGSLSAKVGQHGVLAALVAGSPRSIPGIVMTNVPEYARTAARALWADNGLLLALALPGVILLARRGAYLLLIALVALPVAMATLAPFGGADFHEQRYLAPLAALIFVSGCAALAAAAARAGGGLLLLGTLAALALSGFGSWRALERYAVEVKNITEMQVAVARWLASTREGPGLVATNDIGAIGALTSAPILDLTGLASPDILPYLRQKPEAGRRNLGWNGANEAALLTALRERRPNFVALFPSWYPSPEFQRPLGEPVFRVDLKDNLICGDRTMLVFKPDWGPQMTAPAASVPGAAPPPAAPRAGSQGPRP